MRCNDITGFFQLEVYELLLFVRCVSFYQKRVNVLTNRDSVIALIHLIPLVSFHNPLKTTENQKFYFIRVYKEEKVV